ncbi:hypothetical protein D3C73_1259370 [compost metagenome]
MQSIVDMADRNIITNSWALPCSRYLISSAIVEAPKPTPTVRNSTNDVNRSMDRFISDFRIVSLAMRLAIESAMLTINTMLEAKPI